MHKILHRAWYSLQNLTKDQSGQDLVEYALLCALLASLAVAVFPAIASTSVLFSQAINALSAALTATAGN